MQEGAQVGEVSRDAGDGASSRAGWRGSRWVMETLQHVVGWGAASGLWGACCESFVVQARPEVGPGQGLLGPLGWHPFDTPVVVISKDVLVGLST